LLILLSC